MFVWQLVALGFIALSALLIFGVPVAVYGRQALRDMRDSAAARVLGSGLATLTGAAVMAPFFADALISSQDQALTIAQTISTLSWAV